MGQYSVSYSGICLDNEHNISTNCSHKVWTAVRPVSYYGRIQGSTDVKKNCEQGNGIKLDLDDSSI